MADQDDEWLVSNEMMEKLLPSLGDIPNGDETAIGSEELASGGTEFCCIVYGSVFGPKKYPINAQDIRKAYTRCDEIKRQTFGEAIAVGKGRCG